MSRVAQKRSLVHRRSASVAVPSLVRDPGWSVVRGSGCAARVEVIAADILMVVPWLVHGFSTRLGGESDLGGGRALNLGFTDWDSREAVTGNRGKWLHALGAEAMPLVAMRQIHSDVAHVVGRATGNDNLPREPLSAAMLGDALIVQQPKTLLTVQTADCVPILLVDTARRAVAAVHAGWRGTLARIVSKTLGRMRFEFGTRPADVVAAIGPAIGRCCYEVGPEVAQAFAGQFAGAAEWFDGPFERLSQDERVGTDFLPWLSMIPPGHMPPPERVQLDLRAANRWQLLDTGVKPGNIAVSTLCTACRTDLFFSYRREGPQTGRMMAGIGVREDAALKQSARKSAGRKASAD